MVKTLAEYRKLHEINSNHQSSNSVVSCITNRNPKNELKFVDNGVSDDDLNNFDYFDIFKNIEVLTIQRGNITDLDFLKNFPNLDMLVLIHNKKLKNIEGLQHAKNLDILSINGKDCPPLKIKGVEHATKLRTLHLVGCGINTIDELGKLKILRDVNLNGNNVNDISPLTHCITLEKVQLGDNPVDDFTPLDGLPKLKNAFYQDQKTKKAVDYLAISESLPAPASFKKYLKLISNTKWVISSEKWGYDDKRVAFLATDQYTDSNTGFYVSNKLSAYKLDRKIFVGVDLNIFAVEVDDACSVYSSLSRGVNLSPNKHYNTIISIPIKDCDLMMSQDEFFELLMTPENVKLAKDNFKQIIDDMEKYIEGINKLAKKFAQII